MEQAIRREAARRPVGAARLRAASARLLRWAIAPCAALGLGAAWFGAGFGAPGAQPMPFSVGAGAAAAPLQPPPVPRGVSALGRIEPRGGVFRIATASQRVQPTVQRLLVEQGECVKRGQRLAVLAGAEVEAAAVARASAQLAQAERDAERAVALRRAGITSDVAYEDKLGARNLARAALAAAQAELELSQVRAPRSGCVLAIHAREGERVADDGLLELGDTAAMYAVAEVYESDIGRVRVGQRAHVTSAVLGAPLAGAVEQIGLMIDRQDLLRTDPVLDADARVVQVKIRLDEPQRVARLTHLSVDVTLEP